MNISRAPVRRPSLPLLQLLAALLLAGTAPAASAAPDELVFCYENENVRPWRTRDGGGLNFELLERVAGQLGLRFRFVGAPWKRCLLELKNNSRDGAIGASFKPERLDSGAYPGLPTGLTATPPISTGELHADAGKALYVERYVVVRRKGAATDWTGHEFVNLQRAVGAPLGYSVVDDLRRNGQTVDDGSLTAADVLQKLRLARVDAAVLLHGEMHALLAEDEVLRGQVEILPRPYIEKPYYVMLSHQLLRSDPELAARIWAGIARERATPAWQQRERRATGER